VPHPSRSNATRALSLPLPELAHEQVPPLSLFAFSPIHVVRRVCRLPANEEGKRIWLREPDAIRGRHPLLCAMLHCTPTQV
jgi:hypothetical protein